MGTWVPNDASGPGDGESGGSPEPFDGDLDALDWTPSTVPRMVAYRTPSDLIPSEDVGRAIIEALVLCRQDEADAAVTLLLREMPPGRVIKILLGLLEQRITIQGETLPGLALKFEQHRYGL